MKKLAYTQEYLLCALDAKGNTPSLVVSFPAWLIGCGIYELLYLGYVTPDEKGLIPTSKVWANELTHIRPLYDIIRVSQKPVDSGDIAKIFMLSIQKPDQFKIFKSAVGESLVDEGHADKVQGQGLFKKGIKYAPKHDTVSGVIGRIRHEFIEGGTISDETLYLTVFLYSGNLLGKHFNKNETKEIKNYIKDIPKSKEYLYVKVMIENVISTVSTIISASTSF